MSATHRIGLLLLVGFALILGNTFAGAQGEKAKENVQKWEYCTTTTRGDLEELGVEGWELVAVGQPEARLVYFYLKRPKQ